MAEEKLERVTARITGKERQMVERLRLKWDLETDSQVLRRLIQNAARAEGLWK